MSVSEVERVELVSRLADAIGEEAAETLMKCVLPDGRDQLATKADLGVLKTDLGLLRADLKVLEAETKAEFKKLRAEMETGFATIRAEFRSEFAKQTRRHYGSMVIFIASVWGVLIPQSFV